MYIYIIKQHIVIDLDLKIDRFYSHSIQMSRHSLHSFIVQTHNFNVCVATTFTMIWRPVDQLNFRIGDELTNWFWRRDDQAQGLPWNLDGWLPRVSMKSRSWSPLIVWSPAPGQGHAYAQFNELIWLTSRGETRRLAARVNWPPNLGVDWPPNWPPRCIMFYFIILIL